MTSRVECGDAQELMATIPSESVDLVLVDPPYNKEWLPNWEWMTRSSARILKPGGSFISLCGHFNIGDAIEITSRHLRYWWLLGMSHPGNINRLPGKWVAVKFKPALWFVKERRFKGDTDCPLDLVEGDHKNTLERKSLHGWAQPINWMKHYIERLTPVNGLVCDPCAGTLTTAIAAKLAGRRYICFDIDQDAIERGMPILESLGTIEADETTNPQRFSPPESGGDN